MPTSNFITISVAVDASISKVWTIWTEPDHITQWNFASDEWCCPAAINEPKPDGNMIWRMEAKDGSAGFDFCGKYSEVILHEQLEITLDDGRKIAISFEESEGITTITETFEIEDQNTAELQRQGWQAILYNFKKYAESLQ
jgi:uncharacterized protein YndB with AHSA1/START domain